MSDYDPYEENVREGNLILIVHQDGRDFGIPLGEFTGGMSVGTVSAIDGLFCTVKTDSGIMLKCDVFYEGPKIGDRVAVFATDSRNYAMIGRRSESMAE